MTYEPQNYLRSVAYDTSHRIRTSQLTTLFDGKALGSDEGNLWDMRNSNGGNYSYDSSVLSMTSTGAGWVIRQAKYFCPYFSGKTQVVELTFDQFQPQDNVIKRAGFFSSGTSNPYDQNFDGLWIESSNGTISFNVANNGTVKSIPMNQWNNGGPFVNYDWSGFTVIWMDFLWLGGAAARLFVKTPAGFVHAHTYAFAGSGQPGVFMKSPQQPVRYELRNSGTGNASFRSICSQVASEGSLSEVSQSFALYDTGPVTCATANTIYILKAARASSSYRDQCFFLNDYNVLVTSASSYGMIFLLQEPAANYALTWVDDNRLSRGDIGGHYITSMGTIIDAMPAGTGNTVSNNMTKNINCRLGEYIDGSTLKMMLCYQPFTANQTVVASMNFLRN